MPLYPETKRFLELVPEVDPEKVGVEGFRRIFRELTGVLPREEVSRVEEIVIPGTDGGIPARVYTPASSGSGGVVYYHGGGFVVGDLESYDPFCRALANSSRSVVISVGYRLAPEHRFPAAASDAVDSSAWAVGNAGGFGITRGIAVAGDSAGGNLAAVAALKCRDRGLALKAQVLLFPPISYDVASRSSIEYAESFYLTRKQQEWFGAQYLSRREDVFDPRFSPIQSSDFGGLPPSLVLTAEYDPLRDQGEAYADTLAKSGVAVTSLRVRGVTHGFIGLPGIGGVAFALIGGYLRRIFLG